MKYGPDKTKEICDYLKSGNNRTDSCLLADIHYDTFCQWMLKSEFSDAIKKAEAEFKSYCIGVIKSAAPKSWFAAAWLLERKYSAEYANKNKPEQTISPDAALKMAETTLRLMRELNTNGIKEETRV